MTIAKHIFFSGNVQGVGLRFSANSMAKRYDLTGFVRNTADGKVEILVQGEQQDIQYYLEDLLQSFSVRDTEIEEVPYDSSYEDFRITF